MPQASEAHFGSDDDGASEALALVDSQGEQADDPVVPDAAVQAEEAEASVDADPETKTEVTPEADKADAEPEVVDDEPESPGIDWTDADDDVRAELESKELSEKALEFLAKDAAKTKLDAVRGMNAKFKELSDERKAFETERGALKDKAGNFDKLMDDPKYQKVWARVEAEVSDEDVEEFDAEMATEAEKIEHGRKLAALDRQREDREAQSIDDKVETRRGLVRDDASEYLEKARGVATEDQIKEALGRVDQQLTSFGYGDDNPEAMLEFLSGGDTGVSRFSSMTAHELEQIVARDEASTKATTDEDSKRDTARQARASSPKPDSLADTGTPKWASIKDPAARNRAKTISEFAESGINLDEIMD